MRSVEVSLLAGGAFNKVYTIQAGDDNLVLRVTLPVDPQCKTLSEVATVDWIQSNTILPLPRIIAYNANRENPIDFEWMLMTKIPGRPLTDAWRNIQYPAKERLVQELAVYSSSIFKQQLRGIGNIYPDSDPHSVYNLHPPVQRIVSMLFFFGDHIHLDIVRGPFRTSQEWMLAQLALYEHDAVTKITKYTEKDNAGTDDEDDKDVAERTLRIVRRLRSHADKFFPTSGEDPEPTMLFHDDLSKHNILVSEEGALTGVIDWECVSALPLWKACDYPKFLDEKPRHEEPVRERYGQEDNGEPNELYWETLEDFELTCLRRFFLDEMRRLEPGWIEVFEASEAKRDFELAVNQCDIEFSARYIEGWLDDFEAKKTCARSLRDRFHNSEP